MPDDADDISPDELTNRPAPTEADAVEAVARIRAALDGAQSVRDLAARVENLERLLEQTRNGLGYARSSFAQNVFLARVDEDGAWTEQAPSGTGTNITLTDFADGRSGSDKVIIPIEQAAGSNRVQAVVQLRLGGALQFFGLSSGLQVVKLTSTSGSNGTASTRPSYVYTLDACTFNGGGTATAGAELATGKSPAFGRPKGEVEAAAEYGLAQPSNDGDWVLLYAFEVPDVGTC